MMTFDCKLEGNHPEMPKINVSSWEGVLQFNNARVNFETRLEELGSEEKEKYKSIVNWMRCFIEKYAPELLETKS